MGTWGPGAFQNDHAMDLLSEETARWAEALREALDEPETCWDDIEGLLMYVRLLALAQKESAQFGLLSYRYMPAAQRGRGKQATTAPESSRAVASRWKQRFLDIEATVEQEPGFVPSPAHRARRKAVIKTFDGLIRVLQDDDAPTPKPAGKSRKAK